MTLVRTAFATIALAIALQVPVGATAQEASEASTMEAAILAGARFKTAEAYVRSVASSQSCSVTGYWSGNGVTRKVTFLSHFDVVAAEAAQATGEMRQYRLEDARGTDSEVLLAMLTVSGSGTYAVRKVGDEYGPNGAHLVLQLDDSLIQPSGKSALSASYRRAAPVGAMMQQHDLGGFSVITALPLGGSQRAELRQLFVFDVSRERLSNGFKLYLIDVKGRRREERCSLDRVPGASF
jgi:hypothetical protein